MSDLNLPPDEQADHSGPVVAADDLVDDERDDGASGAGGAGGDGGDPVPSPGAVPPPD